MAADPQYDPAEFQEVLRHWLQRHGLSQMAASQITGISQGVLNRWLKPRGDPYLVQPTVDSLEKLEPHVRIPLVELKRMTNRLSAADLGLLNAVPGRRPPNNRMEAFLNEIRDRWPALEEESPEMLGYAEEIARVAFRLHHDRTRSPRDRRAKKDDGGGSLELLMTA